MVGGAVIGDGAALPLFLARHIELGFDSDDVAALLSSIDSSQSTQMPILPHLPAEIVFHILDYVPAYCLLSWRLVCHGVRDYIDGPLLFQLLKRTELIGYLGPATEWPLSALGAQQYDSIHLLRTSFDYLETNPAPTGTGRKTVPRWSGSRAIFRLDSQWMDTFKLIDNLFKTLQNSTAAWENALDRIQLLEDEKCYGCLRWCLQLDTAVFDLDFPAGSLGGLLEVDLDHAKLTIEWRSLLFRFLKTEALLRSTMKEKRDSTFTFGHLEDCLRAVRRQRLRDALDLNEGPDRRINWEMNLLRPLFGRKHYDRAAEPFNGLERAEAEAIAVLVTLRSQAKMSDEEIAHLKTLAKNRSTMETELKSVHQSFSKWKKQLFGLAPMPSNEWPEQFPKVPYNPLYWTEDVIKREKERVSRWKAQKKVIEKISVLLETSSEAMSMPENAFDDLGSDV